MANTKEILCIEEKGSTTLEDLNLAGLTRKEQKQAAIQYFIDAQKQLAEMDIECDKIRRQAKAISDKLKLAEPVRKLNQLKKDVKRNERTQAELRSRYQGALGILKKMDINISRELSNIKLLEAGIDE